MDFISFSKYEAVKKEGSVNAVKYTAAFLCASGNSPKKENVALVNNSIIITQNSGLTLGNNPVLQNIIMQNNNSNMIKNVIPWKGI